MTELSHLLPLSHPYCGIFYLNRILLCHPQFMQQHTHLMTMRHTCSLHFLTPNIKLVWSLELVAWLLFISSHHIFYIFWLSFKEWCGFLKILLGFIPHNVQNWKSFSGHLHVDDWLIASDKTIFSGKMFSHLKQNAFTEGHNGLSFFRTQPMPY
jgi:hypothetical protein